MVIVVCVLARIEREALADAGGTIAFALAMAVAAATVRHVNERNHRAAMTLPVSDDM